MNNNNYAKGWWDAMSACTEYGIETKPNVPEAPKTLAQRLGDDEDEALTSEYWKSKADIARQHFLEVAERANKKWWKSFEMTKGTNQDYIINAIKNDGK